jgi:hypothetical protein
VRVAILAAVFGCIATIVFILQLQHGMIDFEVYRTAGARALAGEPLYRAADEHFQFKYFPAFALVFVPFALLPPVAAKALWFALSLAALAGLIILSVRLLPRRLLPVSVIVLATVVTLGKFYGRELALGQANLLLGVVVMIGLALLLRRPPLRRGAGDAVAGGMMGAAVLVKPYAIAFLPYLVATRRFRAAAGFTAVLLVILALPAVRYGVGGNVDLLSSWWQTVSSTTPVNLTNQDNISIGGMYAKWLGPGVTADRLTAATAALLFGVCAIAIGVRRPRMRPEYLDVALLLTVIPLLSPQGWDYVLLLSTPAVMLLVNALPAYGRALRLTVLACLALTGLSIYDVMGRAAYQQFMEWSIITPIYGVMIATLVYLRATEIS